MLKYLPLLLCLLLDIIFSTAELQSSKNNKVFTLNVDESLENDIDTNTSLPFVINTWPWPNATQAARLVLESGGSALDGVESGCIACENKECASSVGYGDHPDENGETTLDAMIMDGVTHNVGAVGALRRVKHAISVARAVLERTAHTFLVGELATQFAIEMGFKEETLSTEKSRAQWNFWKSRNCRPNYWMNVSPDPTTSCGPYAPTKLVQELKEDTTIEFQSNEDRRINQENELEFETLEDEVVNNLDDGNHDTIGIITIDSNGTIAAGTTTNGAKFKIPGRVGDSPITGSGAYVDKDVGAAVGTGDGDIMMRYLPSLITVEQMRTGLSPSEAAAVAIARIVSDYPAFSGAIVAVKGTSGEEYGAACHNVRNGFSYCVWNPTMTDVTVNTIQCTSS